MSLEQRIARVAGDLRQAGYDIVAHPNESITLYEKSGVQLMLPKEWAQDANRVLDMTRRTMRVIGITLSPEPSLERIERIRAVSDGGLVAPDDREWLFTEIDGYRAELERLADAEPAHRTRIRKLLDGASA